MEGTVMWILGAPDPEMAAIEGLLRDAGQSFRHATAGGRRVHAGNAYAADPIAVPPGCARVVFVECDAPLTGGSPEVVRCDHHRPGDSGYGRPAAEFLAASSIGQVVAHLVQSQVRSWRGPGRPGPAAPAGTFRYADPDGEPAWRVHDAGTCAWAPVPDAIVLAAAADHCLAAAYRGECPGVDPDALMTWRAESRAAFQKRTVGEILADVEATRRALREAPVLTLGDEVVQDMRREPPWPELPEAAAREGASYVSGPLRGPDGRLKYTCAGPAHVIAAWLRGEGPAEGLVDLYGDPARGFAGGYRK